ncbi:MAG: hypothetical protein ACO36A_05820 [Ilumatobacteraceae bacterium]
MTRNRWTVAVVLVALCAVVPVGVSPGGAATGTLVDEGWAPSFPQDSLGMQGVRFRDVPEYNEAVSVLRARTQATMSSGWWRSCTSLTAAPCSTASQIDFSAVLQPCTGATELDCVVEFGTVSASGARTPATYVSAFPSAGLNDYAADPAFGLPKGGPGAYWNVAESSGAPERRHFVRAVVSGTATPGSKVTFTNLAMNLSPVVVRQVPCGQGTNDAVTGCRPGDVPDLTGIHHNGDASGWAGYVDMGADDCLMIGNHNVAAGTADCAQRRNFNKDITYYLTVRLSQAVSGWMHGRLADPTITLQDVAGSSGAVTLSVAGKPVSVPAVELQKKWSELPASLQDKYRAEGGWPRTGGGYHGASSWGLNDADAADPTKRNRKSLPSPYGADAMAELEAWIPVINDTAIADPSTWALRTLGSNNLGAAAGCVTEKNKVTGIVTTNATQYKAGAPEYDSSSKTLNYKVSAPHYMSSGELFKGAYSLVVRSDVARCIYKFSSAPIKATIEVLDTGADKSTVVTNVSENDGWMKLSASGFTHSSPTIRAAFTQGATTSASDVKAGKSLSRAAVLKKAGLKTTSRSRVSVVVASSSRKVCRVSGTSVRALKKGKCTVSVTVQTGSKRSKKTLRLAVG